MPHSLLDLDPSDDFLIFDGQEVKPAGYLAHDTATDQFPVSAVRIQNSDSISTCLFRAGQEFTIGATAETQSEETVIHIPAAFFVANNITPGKHDVIAQYAGPPLDEVAIAWWHVQELNLQTFGTRYRFVCTKGPAPPNPAS